MCGSAAEGWDWSMAPLPERLGSTGDASTTQPALFPPPSSLMPRAFASSSVLIGTWGSGERRERETLVSPATEYAGCDSASSHLLRTTDGLPSSPSVALACGDCTAAYPPPPNLGAAVEAGVPSALLELRTAAAARPMAGVWLTAYCGGKRCPLAKLKEE
eukprot:scaffold95476_cov17-Tisochrysis_lutea.AAC.1